MSDRISELPVASEAIAGNDLVAVTNVSQSGIGETQKFNWLEMQNGGWINITDTWTYASATTITVPSGAASIYSVGDKIRLKQGAGYKYFYVITVANALLTVTGGSDYTVATPTAITDIYYSHQATPVGFPDSFTLVNPTWTTDSTPFTNQPIGVICKLATLGQIKILTISAQCHATSGGTGSFIATFAGGNLPSATTQLICSSTNLSTATPGYAKIAGLAVYCALAGGNTLATNSQYFRIDIMYI